MKATWLCQCLTWLSECPALAKSFYRILSGQDIIQAVTQRKAEFTSDSQPLSHPPKTIQKWFTPICRLAPQIKECASGKHHKLFHPKIKAQWTASWMEDGGVRVGRNPLLDSTLRKPRYPSILLQIYYKTFDFHFFPIFSDADIPAHIFICLILIRNKEGGRALRPLTHWLLLYID